MVNPPFSDFQVPNAGLPCGEVMTRVPSDRKTYIMPGSTPDDRLTFQT